ncbi:Thioredoxin-1 [Symmachiella macrocystis]|uniref:Thioredoxin n=1 Tax=Symmachiella macrocystis TaxID=2527985 RepID=A0A5C6BPY6_9PLAN|nr:thioredoxin [Symmachiella macrocystis]TWU13461.1 Thioredoxin-1 [Symmachiella macrocystis]
MLNQGIQLYLAVAVSVGGLALWWSLQSPQRQRPQFTTMDTIIERERAELAQPAVINNPTRDVERQLRRAAAPQAAARQARVPHTRVPQAMVPHTAVPQAAAGQPVDVTDATFSSVVLDNDLPVLVDFGADWCGACRMIEPVIHELAGELGGQAVVAQVDVDDNPQIAARYGIKALPTLMVFKDGQPVEKVVGAARKAELRARVDSHTGPSKTLL